MKANEYKQFKNFLIEDKFDEGSYYMKNGSLWFRLTPRQIDDIRATAKGLGVGKEVETGYKIGAWILRY